MSKGTYDDFFDTLGFRESSNRYDIVNIYGSLGRYQMGEASFVDIGLYSADTNAYDNVYGGVFSGKYGVYSVSDFLAKPAAQDQAIRDYMALQFSYLKSVWAYDGQTINGVQVTISGMLAAAHLLGWDGAASWLTSGGDYVPADNFGTQITEYAILLGGYSTPFTINHDVAENLTGGSGSDSFHGRGGDDTIDGKGGDDRITGGQGSDTVDGGEGVDFYYLEATWAAVQWVTSGVTVTFTFVDELLGTDIVSNVEYFIDSLGEQWSWAELTGSPPVVLPAAPVITGFSDNSGVSNDTITNDTTPTLTITTQQDVESVEIFIDGVAMGYATGGSGNFTFTPAVGLEDGSYSFTAKASRGGLTSAASAVVNITIDASAPELVSLTPADDASAVSPSSNIVLTFNKNVFAGSGNIVIWLHSNDTIWRSIPIGSSEVSISGAQVTINPSVDLPPGTAFCVTVEPSALTDQAGNAFAGITDSAAFTFATSAGNLIEGDNGANTLAGTSGNDIINGYGGNDNISGNAGDDIIDGGAGDDGLNGGTNTAFGDTVTYASATAAVTVTLASTRSQNTGGAGRDTLSGFENLTGSDFNDRLTGSTGANTINGGKGDDIITGGRGADVLWGDEGSDTFDFNAVSETGNSATTRDIIMDFEQGRDRIDLSTIDASSALRGNNSFLFRDEQLSFGTASDGEIRYVHENGMTVIYGDTDRDSAPEFQIALNGIYNLTSADFIL